MKKQTIFGSSSLEEDVALRAILEGTATETGGRFFEALVINLSRASGTSCAWVTEYLEEPQRLRALAFCSNGKDGRATTSDLKLPTGKAPFNPCLRYDPHITLRLLSTFPLDHCKPQNAINLERRKEK